MARLLRKVGFELDFIGHRHLRCQLQRRYLGAICEQISLDIYLPRAHQSCLYQNADPELLIKPRPLQHLSPSKPPPPD